MLYSYTVYFNQYLLVMESYFGRAEGVILYH